MNWFVVLGLLVVPATAQIWKAGVNSTVSDCRDCSTTSTIDCWTNTLNFYGQQLITQLRHYIAIQVDIDQWHRRHGLPNGQNYKQVASDIQASFEGMRTTQDLITKDTLDKVAHVLSDRITQIDTNHIEDVPHFECPRTCEYNSDMFMSLFIASIIANLLLIFIAVPNLVSALKTDDEVFIQMDNDNEVNSLLMLADLAQIDDRPPRLEIEDKDVWICPDPTDHSYFQANDVDLLVNSTHDYYRKVDTTDFGDDEHSYSFPPIPREDSLDVNDFNTFDLTESNLTFVNGLVFDTCACEWTNCDFTADSPQNLEKHIVAVHLIPGTRSCGWEDCKKKTHVYAQRYLLTRHIRATHLEYQPFQCIQCGDRFTTAERCRLHTRTIHEHEVKYKCEVCGEFFKTTSDRSHHISRVHMKARIVCPGCGGLYAGRTVLKRHLLRCKAKKNQDPQK